jgi:hypothetical protein
MILYLTKIEPQFKIFIKKGAEEFLVLKMKISKEEQKRR